MAQDTEDIFIALEKAQKNYEKYLYLHDLHKFDVFKNNEEKYQQNHTWDLPLSFSPLLEDKDHDAFLE